jgi:hypothetical protein
LFYKKRSNEKNLSFYDKILEKVIKKKELASFLAKKSVKNYYTLTGDVSFIESLGLRE